MAFVNDNKLKIIGGQFQIITEFDSRSIFIVISIKITCIRIYGKVFSFSNHPRF